MVYMLSGLGARTPVNECMFLYIGGNKMSQIKSGQELSALTSGIRARLAVREHVECPEPKWFRMAVNTLIYALLSGAISYLIIEMVIQ